MNEEEKAKQIYKRVNRWKKKVGYGRLKRRYIAKYPQKERARQILAGRIFRGSIIRPTKCSQCGKVCKPQAHHPNYDKPLDVIWLCRPCHLAVDGKKIKIKQPGDPQS